MPFALPNDSGRRRRPNRIRVVVKTDKDPTVEGKTCIIDYDIIDAGVGNEGEGADINNANGDHDDDKRLLSVFKQLSPQLQPKHRSRDDSKTSMNDEKPQLQRVAQEVQRISHLIYNNAGSKIIATSSIDKIEVLEDMDMILATMVACTPDTAMKVATSAPTATTEAQRAGAISTAISVVAESQPSMAASMDVSTGSSASTTTTITAEGWSSNSDHPARLPNAGSTPSLASSSAPTATSNRESRIHGMGSNTSNGTTTSVGNASSSARATVAVGGAGNPAFTGTNASSETLISAEEDIRTTAAESLASLFTLTTVKTPSSDRTAHSSHATTTTTTQPLPQRTQIAAKNDKATTVGAEDLLAPLVTAATMNTKTTVVGFGGTVSPVAATTVSTDATSRSTLPGEKTPFEPSIPLKKRGPGRPRKANQEKSLEEKKEDSASVEPSSEGGSTQQKNDSPTTTSSQMLLDEKKKDVSSIETSVKVSSGPQENSIPTSASKSNVATNAVVESTSSSPVNDTPTKRGPGRPKKRPKVDEKVEEVQQAAETGELSKKRKSEELTPPKYTRGTKVRKVEVGGRGKKQKPTKIYCGSVANINLSKKFYRVRYFGGEYEYFDFDDPRFDGMVAEAQTPLDPDLHHLVDRGPKGGDPNRSIQELLNRSRDSGKNGSVKNKNPPATATATPPKEEKKVEKEKKKVLQSKLKLSKRLLQQHCNLPPLTERQRSMLRGKPIDMKELKRYLVEDESVPSLQLKKMLQQIEFLMRDERGNTTSVAMFHPEPIEDLSENMVELLEKAKDFEQTYGIDSGRRGTLLFRQPIEYLEKYQKYYYYKYQFCYDDDDDDTEPTDLPLSFGQRNELKGREVDLEDFGNYLYDVQNLRPGTAIRYQKTVIRLIDGDNFSYNSWPDNVFFCPIPPASDNDSEVEFDLSLNIHQMLSDLKLLETKYGTGSDVGGQKIRKPLEMLEQYQQHYYRNKKHMSDDGSGENPSSTIDTNAGADGDVATVIPISDATAAAAAATDNVVIPDSTFEPSPSQKSKPTTPTRGYRQKAVYDAQKVTLTSKQLSSLRGIDIDVEGYRDYLLSAEEQKLSKTYAEALCKELRRLIRGDGVRNKSWPIDVYFQPKVLNMSNLHEIQEEFICFEKEMIEERRKAKKPTQVRKQVGFNIKNLFAKLHMYQAHYYHTKFGMNQAGGNDEEKEDPPASGKDRLGIVSNEVVARDAGDAEHSRGGNAEDGLGSQPNNVLKEAVAIDAGVDSSRGGNAAASDVSQDVSKEADAGILDNVDGRKHDLGEGTALASSTRVDEPSQSASKESASADGADSVPNRKDGSREGDAVTGDPRNVSGGRDVSSSQSEPKMANSSKSTLPVAITRTVNGLFEI